MLERISKFFKKDKKSDITGGYVFGPSEHCLSPEMINRDARKIVDVLQKAGHEAYVVGGCVRDLLLGLKPKDFDVAPAPSPRKSKHCFVARGLSVDAFKLCTCNLAVRLLKSPPFALMKTRVAARVAARIAASRPTVACSLETMFLAASRKMHRVAI